MPYTNSVYWWLWAVIFLASHRCHGMAPGTGLLEWKETGSLGIAGRRDEKGVLPSRSIGCGDVQLSPGTGQWEWVRPTSHPDAWPSLSLGSVGMVLLWWWACDKLLQASLLPCGVGVTKISTRDSGSSLISSTADVGVTLKGPGPFSCPSMCILGYCRGDPSALIPVTGTGGAASPVWGGDKQDHDCRWHDQCCSWWH